MLDSIEKQKIVFESFETTARFSDDLKTIESDRQNTVNKAINTFRALLTKSGLQIVYSAHKAPPVAIIGIGENPL